MRKGRDAGESPLDEESIEMFISTTICRKETNDRVGWWGGADLEIPFPLQLFEAGGWDRGWGVLFWIVVEGVARDLEDESEEGKVMDAVHLGGCKSMEN
jgi:hypothetical protein